GTATRYFTNTWSEDIVSTVIVAGQSAQNGLAVTASSTAMALVVPIELPPLSIVATKGGFVLKWNSGSLTGMVLEATSDLSPTPVWRVIPNAVSPFVTTKQAGKPTQFYRL